jgi:hypothetical protein
MAKKYMSEINAENTESEVEAPVVEAKKGLLRRLGLKRISLLILILIAIGGLLGTRYFYNKYQDLKNNANIEAEREVQKLVSVLGKLMELPAGEVPTVATISDKEKLTGQAFFAQAENGDILFAYTSAMKAILYRPMTNKIINVAPISINSTPTTP